MPFHAHQKLPHFVLASCSLQHVWQADAKTSVSLQDPSAQLQGSYEIEIPNAPFLGDTLDPYVGCVWAEFSLTDVHLSNSRGGRGRRRSCFQTGYQGLRPAVGASRIGAHASRRLAVSCVSWWFLSDFAASSSGVAGVAFEARACRCVCRRAVGLRVSRWFRSDFALLRGWRGGLKIFFTRLFFESCVSWWFRSHFRCVLAFNRAFTPI